MSPGCSRDDPSARYAERGVDRCARLPAGRRRIALANGRRCRRVDRAYCALAGRRAGRPELGAPPHRSTAARRRDRGRSGQDRPSLDYVADALHLLLWSCSSFGALWATAQLIDDLIHGGATTNSASDLLEAGSVVWMSNIVAFALLYWELDGGGAAASTRPRLGGPASAVASSTGTLARQAVRQQAIKPGRSSRSSIPTVSEPETRGRGVLGPSRKQPLQASETGYVRACPFGRPTRADALALRHERMHSKCGAAGTRQARSRPSLALSSTRQRGRSPGTGAARGPPGRPLGTEPSPHRG